MNSSKTFQRSWFLFCAGALAMLSCATTTIHSGYGHGLGSDRDASGRLVSKEGRTDIEDPECRCDPKSKKAAGFVEKKTEDLPTERSATQPTKETAVVPVERQMPVSAETRPADVRNDVKVVVEKEPAGRASTEPVERQETAAVEPKARGREDSYFVVARDGDKPSVYDRKAEEPEAKEPGREEPKADPKEGRTSAEDPTGEKFFTESDHGDFDQKGTASWYGRDFDGRPTASGEKFDSRKLTAAHREFPLGTIILVRNMENKKEVILRINDRGPFVKGRVLDVSEYASERLGYKEKGLTTVGIRVIRPGDVKSRGAGATKAYYDIGKGESSETKDGGDNSRGSVDRRETDERPPIRRAGGVVPEKTIREVKREYRSEETVSGYSVQVGVFEKEFNALAASETLRYLNVPLRVVKRGSLFVVKAGNFSSRGPAESLREKLAAAGHNVFVTGP